MIAELLSLLAEGRVLPATAADVARALAWCYEHDVPVTPRGGVSGYPGGAAPDGGVVLATERQHAVARENGLYYPPDPGAAEQSHLGGNVATITGEHGLGLLRSGEFERMWAPRALDLHEAVKRAFDPTGLLNPGEMAARC